MEKVTKNLEEVTILRKEVNNLKESQLKQEKDMNILRVPPVSFHCAFRSEVDSVGTVSYDKMFYERSNVESEGPDINTGKFTCGHPGTYSITFSAVGYNREGADLFYDTIYVFKNNERLIETCFTSGSSANGDDQGSTTAFLHLDKGDSVEIRVSALNA